MIVDNYLMRFSYPHFIKKGVTYRNIGHFFIKKFL